MGLDGSVFLPGAEAAGDRRTRSTRRPAGQRPLAGRQPRRLDARGLRRRAGALRAQAQARGLDAARPLVRRLRGDAVPRRLPGQRDAADRLLHRRRRGARARRARGPVRGAARGRRRLASRPPSTASTTSRRSTTAARVWLDQMPFFVGAPDRVETVRAAFADVAYRVDIMREASRLGRAARARPRCATATSRCSRSPASTIARRRRPPRAGSPRPRRAASCSMIEGTGHFPFAEAPEAYWGGVPGVAGAMSTPDQVSPASRSRSTPRALAELAAAASAPSAARAASGEEVLVGLTVVRRRGGRPQRGRVRVAPRRRGLVLLRAARPRRRRARRARRRAAARGVAGPGASPTSPPPGARSRAARWRARPTGRPAPGWWRSAASPSRPRAAPRRTGRASARASWSCPRSRWRAATARSASRWRRWPRPTTCPRSSRTASRRGPPGCASAPLPLLDPAPAGRFRIASTAPPEHYEEAVARAVERIRAGALEKIVLAREVAVHAPAPHDAAATFGVLRAAFGSCFVFCAGRGDRAFVAASPELLVRREGLRDVDRRAGRLDPPLGRPGRRRPPRRAAAAARPRTARSRRSSPAGSPARCARTRSGSRRPTSRR